MEDLQTTDETDLTVDVEADDGWNEEEGGRRPPCAHQSLLIDTSTSSA